MQTILIDIFYPHCIFIMADKLDDKLIGMRKKAKKDDDSKSNKICLKNDNDSDSESDRERESDSEEEPLTPTEEKFLENVHDFVDIVVDILCDVHCNGYKIEPKITRVLRNIKYYPVQCLMNLFIEYTKEYWYKIVERDEVFLINILSIYFDESLSIDIRGLFLMKNQSGELLITQLDRDNIWRYILSFVKLAGLHIHES